MPNWRETPYDPMSLSEAARVALARSESARRAADARRAEMRARVVRWLQRRALSEMPWWRQVWVDESRIPVSRLEVDVVLNTWMKTDMWWRGHIDDDRWFLQQSVSYATSAHTASRRDDR